MDKKTRRRVSAVCIIMLLISIVIDATGEDVIRDGMLVRNGIGEDDEEIQLILDMNDGAQTYEYDITVEPMRVTKEQADGYFAGAVAEIEADFQLIEEIVPVSASYQMGLVDASWSFYPRGIVTQNGDVVWEEIPEDGAMVSAEVMLECGEYEQIYQFAFMLKAPILSAEEKAMQALDIWMETEMQKEGEEMVALPTELEGVRLQWSSKTDSLTGKMVLLEIIMVFLLWYMQKKQNEQEKRKRNRSMESEYPEIIEQLALLLGAGMTIRQAWNRIATRYSDKRQKEQTHENLIMEHVVAMNRRITEGENERIAYQRFADEVGLACYHRLIRLLLGNFEKGSSGIAQSLEQEGRLAYEQRIHQAKKLGEEASTRMLMPLMCMMLVVMAIVMIPALLSFSI